MRVLLLADGSSVHAARYKAELKRQGVEVYLTSLEEGNTVDIYIPKNIGINIIDYVLASRFLKNIISKLSPDIINPHFVSGYGYKTALSGVWKYKPVLLHCLGSDILISPNKTWLHKKRACYALSRADHVLVDSDYLRDKVKELNPKSNVDVIAWGADEEAFVHFEKKRQCEFRWNQPPRIIVPRAHYKIYNNLFIVESLRELINDGKLKIAFPAWGDESDKFKKIAGKYCPGSGIEYYEFKSRPEFNSYLAGFDIYLSASLSDSSPASLIEAMAAGLYPVVGDIPGVREWVSDINGSLFDLSDTGSLRENLLNLMDEPLALKDVLRNNYNKARENGMFSKNIAATIQLMERMISSDKSRK